MGEYFIFSAFAGQLTDKLEKSWIIRQTKVLEIIIMLLAALGFYLENNEYLIFVLFLMGAQSAFFGPAKYSILPQHLKPEELMSGNALVEMGTFLAILLGTVAGGVLISIPQRGPFWVSLGLVAVAVLGWLASLNVPEAKAPNPSLQIKYNPMVETFKNMRDLADNRFVFIAIMAISWFWFFGYFYLAQFPSYTKEILGGDEHIVTLLLTIFSIGIGLGSWLCERLSNKLIELGLVPIGALGLTIFSIDIYLARPVAADNLAALISISEFLSVGANYRLILDLILVGLFGGFFIVPLYAAIQERGDRTRLSRQVASNNIYNALFMVGAAICAMILAKFSITIPQMFVIMAVTNLVALFLLVLSLPEFALRTQLWFLYRWPKENKENKENQRKYVLKEELLNVVILPSSSQDRNAWGNTVYHLRQRAVLWVPQLPLLYRLFGRSGRDYILYEEEISRALSDPHTVLVIDQMLWDKHSPAILKFSPSLNIL